MLDYRSQTNWECRSLQNEQLIKVYVGERKSEIKPYLIQQTLLESTSTVFAAAIQPHAFKEGQERCLHFPDDDSTVWGVLVYWIIKREMPKTLSDVPTCCVRCWVLGDRYDIKDFQDQAMLALIRYCEDKRLDVGVMKEAVSNSAQGTKLRQLVAQEAVRYQNKDKNASLDDFKDFDGVGFTTDYLYAQYAYDNGTIRYKRLEEGDRNVKPAWKEFMVGDGPKSY